MDLLDLRVAEVTALGNLRRVRCAGEARLGSWSLADKVRPGECFLSRADIPSQPSVRVPIFPLLSSGHMLEFLVDPHDPYAALAPGDRLEVLGPVGCGFHLPPGAFTLLAVAQSPARLYPLIAKSIARGGAVAFLVSGEAASREAVLPALPEQVELPAGGLTSEMVAWADLIALDMPDPLERAREIRALHLGRRRGGLQALITPPMPCGTGACQGCWVETEHGRKLACVDGPVFSL